MDTVEAMSDFLVRYRYFTRCFPQKEKKKDIIQLSRRLYTNIQWYSTVPRAAPLTGLECRGAVHGSLSLRMTARRWSDYKLLAVSSQPHRAKNKIRA